MPTQIRSMTPRVTEGSADAGTVAWTRAMLASFLGPRLESEQLARIGAGFEGMRLRGAYDDPDPSPVATLRSWDAELTVPGGTLTAHAVTGIGVRSTHRRRGLARRLLAEDLAAAVRTGSPAAVLTSTQGSLYERFGFGLATRTRSITLDATSARFRDAEPRGTVEIVDRPDAALALARPVHDRARRRHPGALARTPQQWDAVLSGAGPWNGLEPDRARQVVIWRDDDGEPAGYVVHRVEEGWYATGSATLGVADLQAVTPTAYAELWRHLCGQDLVGTVRWGQASVDEPLGWLLSDHRAVTVEGDKAMLWLRVLDVPALLAARRYPIEDAIVLEVADDAGFTPGRWRLDTHDRLAPAVEPTRDTPDVVLPVTSLGSLVLGGVDPRVLARTGRLEEASPGAAGRLARLLAAPSVPWNGTPF
ncbi:GNAT family N-acetyltransferase [Actinomycetospora endophytica]|uniref:GNAT family N-acetyltransferase n=1 Tax=Actinomycetospora endophytica TaxID=2291215 RepID=A0ABS8PFU4_9PSEU|nr:GNAT family N-acetyltransferase [Actinomycetospora endophytica]MCD2197140.1 GNAT family N-acetyltransferase [Actinomycetospora endophytica]